MKIQFNPDRDYQWEAVASIVKRLRADDTPTSASGANKQPANKKDRISCDSASLRPRVYSDVPGFCKAETIGGIGKHGFVLAPDGYVGAEEQEDDGEPFPEKHPRLLAELEECFGEGERLMVVVRVKLSEFSSGE